MEGGGGRGGRSIGIAPPPDLLVCFPARGHMALLIPKPICSSSTPPTPPPPESGKRHRRRPTKPAASSLFNAIGGGESRRYMYSSGTLADVPRSPEVTCAGKVKDRRQLPEKNSRGSRYDWLSDETLLSKERKKKKPQHWLELCLNELLSGVRFRSGRCFGCFPAAGSMIGCSDGHDEEEEGGGGNEEFGKEKKRVFSNWVMVVEQGKDSDVAPESGTPTPPPANALLLMRCRSAPSAQTAGGKDEEEKLKLMKERLAVGGVSPPLLTTRSRSYRR